MAETKKLSSNLKVTGKSLAKANGLYAKQALYRETGDWYHILTKFPAALLEPTGYILFETRSGYDSFITNGHAVGVNENREKNWLTIKGGIRLHSSFLPFSEVLYPDEFSGTEIFTEGKSLSVRVNRFERNAIARQKCLDRYGLSCVVCSVNFQKLYGSIGKNFIHVHHLIPISSIGTVYEIDPLNDLRPVCPNCHAMLHRKSPPFSIGELREQMNLASIASPPESPPQHSPLNP